MMTGCFLAAINLVLIETEFHIIGRLLGLTSAVYFLLALRIKNDKL